MDGLYLQESNETLQRVGAPFVLTGTMTLHKDGWCRQYGYRSGDLTLCWGGRYDIQKDYQGNPGEYVVLQLKEVQPPSAQVNRDKPLVYSVCRGRAAFKIGNSVYQRVMPETELGRSAVLCAVAHTMCAFQQPLFQTQSPQLYREAGRHYFEVEFEGDYESHLRALNVNGGLVELPNYYRIADYSPLPVSPLSMGLPQQLMTTLRSYDPTTEYLLMAVFKRQNAKFLFKGNPQGLHRL